MGIIKMEEMYNIQKNKEELVEILEILDISFDEELEFCTIGDVGIDFKNIDTIKYDVELKEVEITYFSKNANAPNWMKSTPKTLRYKNE